MEEQEYIDRFDSFLKKESGLFNTTRCQYIEDLHDFTGYLPARYGFTRVTDCDILAYRDYLLSNNKAAASINRKMSSLRRFYRFMEDEGYLHQNPTEVLVGLNIRPEYRRVTLTLEEVIRLIGNPVSESDPFIVRNSIIIATGYMMALKVTELIEIKIDTVDIINQKLSIPGLGKRQDRNIRIPDILMPYLSYYLKSIRDDILNGRVSSYLFPSKKAVKLNRKSIWRILKRYAQECGITKNIDMETLRLSKIHHLHQSGKNTKEIQEITGLLHESSITFILKKGKD